MNELQTRTYVVVINGTAGAGKDTFAGMCHKYCDDTECANLINISSIDPVKDLLRNLGWDGIRKTDEVRDMLAGMKRFWSDRQNGPTLYLLTNILNFHQMHMKEDNIVFCHIREPEEIVKLRKIIEPMHIFGIKFMTLLVERKSAGTSAANTSDDVENICRLAYDIRINNDSDLPKLDYEASRFINSLIK